jgi:hypothetical protein
VLNGGSQGDTLFGGDGIDTLNGDDGNDTVVVNLLGGSLLAGEVINGGTGTDTVQVSGSPGVPQDFRLLASLSSIAGRSRASATSMPMPTATSCGATSTAWSSPGNGGRGAGHQAQPAGRPATYQIAGTYDFDSDGDADILFRHDSGLTVTWEMAAGALLQTHSFGVIPNVWQIRGTGEFDSL